MSDAERESCRCGQRSKSAESVRCLNCRRTKMLRSCCLRRSVDGGDGGPSDHVELSGPCDVALGDRVQDAASKIWIFRVHVLVCGR